MNYSASAGRLDEERAAGGGEGRTAPSYVHVSRSLDGPWTPLPNTHELASCSCPAPWVHANGTIFMACQQRPAASAFMRAED